MNARKALLLALASVTLATPAALRAEHFVYTTHQTDGTIAGFVQDPATGGLTAIPGSPFPAGGQLIGAVLSPSGRFLYANLDAATPGIRAFAVHPTTGALTEVPGSPFLTPGAGQSTHVAVHPSGRFVYLSHAGTNAIAVFAVNPATGSLTQIPGSPFVTGGILPFNTATDPFGRFLFVANVNSSQVTVFTIDPASGALGPVPGSPFAAGGANYGVAPEPTGRFLYVPSHAGDVYVYAIHPTTGVLTQIPGSPFVMGTAGMEANVDPSGRFLYVAARFAGVAAFTINATTGALTPVTGSPFPGNFQSRRVVVDATGRYVYLSNNTEHLSAYSIDLNTGALTQLAGSPFPTGGLNPWGLAAGAVQVKDLVYGCHGFGGGIVGYAADPANGALAPVPGSPFPLGGVVFGCALHPDGKYLYAANAGTIAVYAVHATSGALTAVPGSPFSVTGSGPIHVTVHPAGRLVFGVTSDNTVSAFTIDPTTGSLTAVPGSPFATGGTGSSSATADPSGRFLFVANFFSHDVSAFGVDRLTGILTPVPGSPFPIASNSVYSVAVEPTGRFAYAGSEAGAVFAFAIGANGALQEVVGSPFIGTGDSVELTVERSGRFLYTAGRVQPSLGDGSDAVSGFAINATTGALTALPGSPFPADNAPTNVVSDAEGRYLYVSGEAPSTLFAYAIHPATGALTPMPGSPFATGGAGFRGLAAGRDFTRGDFNRNGLTDILWRHETSGQNVVWHMDGPTLRTGAFVMPLSDTGWKMVGTHDFNRDRETDILWRHETSGQNVLWYMDEGIFTSGTFLSPAALADVNWKMAGTGDFNQDGKPDIAWHHRVSGEVVLWFMNGSVLESGTFTSPPALTDTGWQIVGVGDFSGDHKPDLLWRHQTSGQNVVWFMNGHVLTSGTFTTPSSLPDTNWKMVAVGDYTVPADGKPDIVWRHSVSGQNVIWFMNGTVLSSGTFTNPSSFPDPGWKIVGPR